MVNSLTYKVDRRVTALQAQGIANEFLSNFLPDRFTADQPKSADNQWRVPVILAYPHIGSLGTVGEIQIDLAIGTILSYTPLNQMKQTGTELYIANQSAQPPKKVERNQLLPKPWELLDALQDPIHREVGRSRLAKSVRSKKNLQS
jgi:hypothetical protein